MSRKNFNLSLGQRIRYYREKLNLSQEELAHHLGYKSRVTVSRIESGQHNVSAEHMVLLSNLFKMPISEIIAENQAVIEEKNIATLLYRDEDLEVEDVNKVLDFIAFLKQARSRD